MFYSTSLLLSSYYTMHILCLISLAIFLLAPVCLCSRHGFQYLFMIQIYRYMCAYPCTPLGIHHTTRWGVSDSFGSSCPDLRVYGFSRLQIRDVELKRGSAADRLRPYPFRPPALLSSFTSITHERLL